MNEEHDVDATRMSVRTNDKRWYLWVPGIATLLCVPFQFLAYLSADRAVVLPSFVGLMFMAAVFFGLAGGVIDCIPSPRLAGGALGSIMVVTRLARMEKIGIGAPA